MSSYSSNHCFIWFRLYASTSFHYIGKPLFLWNGVSFKMFTLLGMYVFIWLRFIFVTLLFILFGSWTETSFYIILFLNTFLQSRNYLVLDFYVEHKSWRRSEQWSFFVFFCYLSFWLLQICFPTFQCSFFFIVFVF